MVIGLKQMIAANIGDAAQQDGCARTHDLMEILRAGKIQRTGRCMIETSLRLFQGTSQKLLLRTRGGSTPRTLQAFTGQCLLQQGLAYTQLGEISDEPRLNTTTQRGLVMRLRHIGRNRVFG